MVVVCVQLNDKPRGEFRVPATPSRDELAYKLAEKARIKAAARSGNGQAAAKRARLTPSTGAGAGSGLGAATPQLQLSPAAARLAQRMKSPMTAAGDAQLRASYLYAH